MVLGQVDGGISVGVCYFHALPQQPGQDQVHRSALSFSGEECSEALSHSSGCASDLGNPDRLLWLPSPGDHSVQEALGLWGLAGSCGVSGKLLSTQHVSCLSCAFGELGGEARA